MNELPVSEDDDSDNSVDRSSDGDSSDQDEGVASTPAVSNAGSFKEGSVLFTADYCDNSHFNWPYIERLDNLYSFMFFVKHFSTDTEAEHMPDAINLLS